MIIYAQCRLGFTAQDSTEAQCLCPVMIMLQVAVVYSCTRALQNHAYSYLPFFLIYTLDLGKVCTDVK